jgi:hypothetical protein
MMRRIVMPVPSKDKTVKIQYVDGGETMTGRISPVTMNFMENGYVVLKNFIPKEIITMTLDAWKVIENEETHNQHFFHREEDIIDASPKDTLFKSQGAYQFPPAVALQHWLRNALEDVFDLKLVETYAFTRKYDRGAYLNAHVDRPSCEISTTICLDYKSDDNSPWNIWVKHGTSVIEHPDINVIQSLTQEKNHRERKKNGAACISLEVGDVLLYQGPNAIHWRDRFLGEYSYHMFLHFINGIGRTVDMPNAKGKVDRGVDPRNAGVFSYDGRPNRYAPESEKSVQFEKAMDAWNNWDEKKYGKKSDYLNNYSHITVVEEKKKK